MITHKISVLIIDSEPKSLEDINKLLNADPAVCEISSAVDSDKALLILMESNPDLILLEYPFKGKAGEGLIRFIKTKLTGTTLVYVSKSKEHAVHAIRNEVYDYLLKPVLKAELETITNMVFLLKQNNLQSRVNQIIEQSAGENKIRVQTFRGYLILDPEEILFCRADHLYTKVYSTQDRMDVCYVILKKVERILTPLNFLRVSRLYLINMKYIRRIIKNKNTIILSSEGKEYAIKTSKTHIRNLSRIENE